MSELKRAILKVVLQEKVVETIPLHAKTVVIGREKSDIVLNDSEVSSAHSQIEQVGDGWHLFDLHSTNGTFVNGQRIVKSRLTQGDRIRIGTCEFIFDLEECAESSISFLGRELDPARYAAPMGGSEQEIDELLSAERAACLRSMRLIAEVSYHDGSREIIETEGEIVIGRSSTLGRFSNDDELSRRHARIFLDDDASVWIEDLGSTNGVVVNSGKISKPIKLNPDDVVRAGRTRLKVQIRVGAAYKST
jgi:pSer/pThr/pTyr-binding forkhead associated (FHA) protein